MLVALMFDKIDERVKMSVSSQRRTISFRQTNPEKNDRITFVPANLAHFFAKAIARHQYPLAFIAC